MSPSSWKRQRHRLLDPGEHVAQQPLGHLARAWSVAAEEQDQPGPESPERADVERVRTVLVHAYELHRAHLAVGAHAHPQIQRTQVLVVIEESTKRVWAVARDTACPNARSRDRADFAPSNDAASSSNASRAARRTSMRRPRCERARVVHKRARRRMMRAVDLLELLAVLLEAASSRGRRRSLDVAPGRGGSPRTRAIQRALDGKVFAPMRTSRQRVTRSSRYTSRAKSELSQLDGGSRAPAITSSKTSGARPRRR